MVGSGFFRRMARAPGSAGVGAGGGGKVLINPTQLGRSCAQVLPRRADAARHLGGFGFGGCRSTVGHFHLTVELQPGSGRSASGAAGLLEPVLFLGDLRLQLSDRGGVSGLVAPFAAAPVLAPAHAALPASGPRGRRAPARPLVTVDEVSSAALVGMGGGSSAAASAATASRHAFPATTPLWTWG